MAKGINKVILVGNLGDDPETKYTQGGTCVTQIRLATTEKFKNREQQLVEKTEWHNVTFFGKVAEVAGEYLRKGSQVYIEGKIQYRQVDGNDGQKRYFTDIICHEMQMLGGKPDDSRGERPRQSGGSAPRSQQRAPARDNDAQRERARETAPASRDFGDDFADDDIPF